VEAMLLHTKLYDTEDAERGRHRPVPVLHPELSAFLSDAIMVAAQTAHAIGE
jgi:hypothetical protein